MRIDRERRVLAVKDIERGFHKKRIEKERGETVVAADVFKCLVAESLILLVLGLWATIL